MVLSKERKELYDGIVEEVGFPEVERIDGILPNENVLYAIRTDKNEAENHYLQLHPQLLQQAEEKGFLVPGESRIIDTSSSNSAISLALAAQKAGFPLRIIIPTELEDSVRAYTVDAILKAGGIVQYPDPDIHTKLRYVAACAKQLEREIKKKGEHDFVLNHSRCYETLAGLEEMTSIICDRLRVQIDYFLPGVGNGATILGPGKVLKERYGTKIIAWEPVSSGLAFDMKKPGEYERKVGMPRGTFRHNIYGVGVPDVKFPFLKASIFGGDLFGISFNETGNKDDKKFYASVVNDVVMVANKFMVNDFLEEGGNPDRIRDVLNYDSLYREILNKGLEVGRSSAASIAVAKGLAQNVKKKNFLVFCYDSAKKYEKDSKLY